MRPPGCLSHSWPRGDRCVFRAPPRCEGLFSDPRLRSVFTRQVLTAGNRRGSWPWPDEKGALEGRREGQRRTRRAPPTRPAGQLQENVMTRYACVIFTVAFVTSAHAAPESVRSRKIPKLPAMSIRRRHRCASRSNSWSRCWTPLNNMRPARCGSRSPHRELATTRPVLT